MRHQSPGGACVVLLVSMACSDPVSSTATHGARSAAEFSLGASTLAPPHALGDQRFIAAAEAVTGFGGFFLDEDGNPTVYLRDPALAPIVDAKLRAMFLGEPVVAGQRTFANGRAVRYRVGRYDFRQLAGFRVVAERLLDQEQSAVSIDVDEANNRVAVAVSDVAAQRRLTEAIRAAGIPAEAFSVHPEERHVTLAGPGDSLASFFNPPAIPAGVQVSYRRQGDIHGGFACTLGFNINWGGRSAFVTNSHCTARTASLHDLSEAAVPNFPFKVGVEVADPAPWQDTEDCLFSRIFEGRDICRYSDAAVYVADTVANSDFKVGYIARTLGSGSKAINPATPHWEIIGKKTTIYAGEWTDRIGISTGWTSAQIATTCFTQYITTSNDGTKAKWWCQYSTYGSASTGDSGGPVAFWTWCNIFQENRADGTPCTYIGGVAHSTGSNRVHFSPISGIETDLGVSLLVLPSHQPP